MAAGFLRNVFRTPSPTPPEVAEELGELARLASERPTLAGPAALLGDILPGLFREPIREPVPSLATELAATKLAGGLPLLRGECLALDAGTFRRRWEHVCAAVARQPEGDAASHLARALRRGHLNPSELVADLLAGRPESLAARAAALDLDAGLTAAVFRLTLFPVLAHLSAALAPLRESSGWEQGHCPTCGSWPLLAELRGLDQSRFLRCGWCAGGWEFPRLRCPFCGTRDHHALGNLHVEGDEARCRAATCDACRGYVKALSTLGELSPPRLLVADLATTHLDLAAADRGYLVPPR